MSTNDSQISCSENWKLHDQLGQEQEPLSRSLECKQLISFFYFVSNMYILTFNINSHFFSFLKVFNLRDHNKYIHTYNVQHVYQLIPYCSSTSKRARLLDLASSHIGLDQAYLTVSNTQYIFGYQNFIGGTLIRSQLRLLQLQIQLEDLYEAITKKIFQNVNNFGPVWLILAW